MLNKFHASGATASYNQCNRIRSDAKSFSSVLSNGVISDAKSISSVYRTVEQRYGTTGTGTVLVPYYGTVRTVVVHILVTPKGTLGHNLRGIVTTS